MKPAAASKCAMSVELTYNYDDRTYSEGEAWGHLCVRVDDLTEDWEQLTLRDAPDYRDPASCDNLYAFTKDQDGRDIELLKRDTETDSLFPF
jgi:lactoylglutathione lyase